MSAHSIVSPDVSAETSTFVYGLGWFRTTLIGHDVSEGLFFLNPIRDNNVASMMMLL
jgi:hypothetical protein